MRALLALVLVLAASVVSVPVQGQESARELVVEAVVLVGKAQASEDLAAIIHDSQRV